MQPQSQIVFRLMISLAKQNHNIYLLKTALIFIDVE